MSNVNMMFTVAAAEIGALVAIYVILGVLIALAVFALVRLAILAGLKRPSSPDKKDDMATMDTRETAPQEKGVDPALLKEKENEIATLEERIRQLEKEKETPAPVVVAAAETPSAESVDCESCEKVAELKEKVVFLENRVHELESRPATVVYVQQDAAAEPAPMEESNISTRRL